MDLSIIIVNWKSAAYLDKCLRSIYGNAKEVDFEVIVVDNASGDDCLEFLTREFPLVHCISSPDNLGFAAANNLGATCAAGRNLLFLNPDTVVMESALQTMLIILDELADAGVVGPMLLNSDFTVQTSCVQSFPTILNQILDSEALRKRFPNSELWGMQALFTSSDAPTDVDAISGACMMMKSDTFAKVGGFSTDYFMYSEDVDLCFRIKKAGFHNYFVGSARVVHHGGRSSASEPQNNFAAVLMRESRLRWLRTWRGATYAAAYRAATALAATGRVAILGAGIVIARRADRKRSLGYSAEKWIRILRWSVGLEPWAKNLSAQAEKA
jgi:N-acetylglucosaminyl-diphospho-decaprenol L-rhamnosyltransferase